MSTYVVSDLHGNYETFKKGLKTINFTDEDNLICLGDSIDRGPNGIKILEEIKDTPNMDTLLGNHELFMVDCVEKNGKPKCVGFDTDLWLHYNGGDFTFQKYADLSEKKRLELLNWLKSRKLITRVELNDKIFILTHSCYVENIEEMPFNEVSHEKAWMTVWLNPYRRHDTHCNPYSTYGKHPELTFITGHVPVQVASYDYTMIPAPFTNNTAHNMIDIDGGLAYDGMDGIRGAAIFLRLDDMEHFTIFNRDIEE